MHRRGFSILVLCAGNIGRSPLAEMMLRSALASALGWTEAEMQSQGVVVTSAGTEAPEGHAASDRGVAFADRAWSRSLLSPRARR